MNLHPISSLSFALIWPGYLLLFAPYLITIVCPAAGSNRAEISPGVLLHRYSPLRHQFLPILLSLQTSHRPIVLIRDHLDKFNGKSREGRVLACVTHGLGSPLALLRPNIGSRKDPMCRVDQEEYEDPAVTRLGGIFQAEWLYTVLIQVRERDTSVSFRDHIADILHTRAEPDTRSLQSTGLGRGR